MGFGGIVGWGGSGGNGGINAPTVGSIPIETPPQVNYGSPQTNVPVGYQPIASQGASYSGGADVGSTSPTVANNSFNWQQLGQNPKKYALNQGLNAIGATPGTAVGDIVGNPIGTIGQGVQNLFTTNPTPNADTEGANLETANTAAQLNNAAEADSPLVGEDSSPAVEDSGLVGALFL